MVGRLRGPLRYARERNRSVSSVRVIFAVMAVGWSVCSGEGDSCLNREDGRSVALPFLVEEKALPYPVVIAEWRRGANNHIEDSNQ